MTAGASAELAAQGLEHVGCDLCGADDAAPALELRDLMFHTTDDRFQLVRCRACGLHYLNPRPCADRLGRFYRDDYAPFARTGIAARVKRWTLQRNVNDLWPVLAPPARVLDLGCATGELLQVIKERGNPNLLGIEPNQHAAAIARDCHGVEVFEGTLEQTDLEDASLDVALLAHTIEHLPSPSRTLAELSRVLKPGGALVLWLPNTNSFAATVLGQYWVGYDAPRHLYDFTPETVSQLLDKSGFGIRSTTHEWLGLEWSWAVRLYARDRLPSRPLDRVLAALHPALTMALSPISTGAALTRRAGRIRVVAGKRG